MDRWQLRALESEVWMASSASYMLHQTGGDDEVRTL